MTITVLLAGCSKEPLNDPHPDSNGNEKILFTAFNERPKHLDPAISYSSEEATFTYQIYEPTLQYHYLKRPFQLVPLTASDMPSITYLNASGANVNETSPDVVFSVYRISIKPNINYQPHPAFAKLPGSNQYRYHDLSEKEAKGKHSLSDFPYTDTRELVAEDYIYEIKRLASPAINSPIFGLMEEYIVGFKDFANKVKNNDLRDVDLEGVTLIDKYTFEIKLKGRYPQFVQWLAMPFFAPVPWEAVKFYSQPLLQKQNVTLDWYPVGTGPFMLTKNNPNLQMILSRNPNFHGETYPSDGEEGDEAAGLLTYKNQPLPFLDKVVFVLEKEDIPYWNKFLQGYYDLSGVTTNNFDQALKSMDAESVELSDELKEKGVSLVKTTLPTVFYWGFNMLDDTVGGYSEKNKKLRRALGIAFDMEEYITIFLNGRGKVAHSPIPEGIFGYSNDPSDVNPYLYDGKRKSIIEAKRLLSEAGFPRGINPKTKQPLSITLDIPVSSGPDAAAQLAWFRKQFEKLGIELVINATQYSRFQDRVKNGDFQIFVWGWNADYPDPENFFFLLDSENGKVKFQGENACNYANPKIDELFKKMKLMNDGEERKNIITEMTKIIQEDLPWMAAYYPTLFSLRQQWMGFTKPNVIARNTFKYITLDPALREKSQNKWNTPIFWPIITVFVVLILMCIPAIQLYIKKTRSPYRLYPRGKIK